MLTVVPRIHSLLSLEVAPSQLFPLPVYLSHSREILFRNASGRDAAELLLNSRLLSSQELFFLKFKLTDC